MKSIKKVNDSFSIIYDNYILIGDFNATETDISVGRFCDMYSLKSLIKDPTCFKNPYYAKFIDLMMKIDQDGFRVLG